MIEICPRGRDFLTFAPSHRYGDRFPDEILISSSVLVFGSLIIILYLCVLCECCRQSSTVDFLIVVLAFYSTLIIMVFEGDQKNGNFICFFGSEYQKDHDRKESVGLLASIRQPVIILGRLSMTYIGIRGFLKQGACKQPENFCTEMTTCMLKLSLIFSVIILLNNCTHYFFGCYIHPVPLIPGRIINFT